MSELLSVPVLSKNGLRGKVLTTSKLLDDRPSKSIVFDSGREVSVGSEHLLLQKDGSYYLDLNVDPSPRGVTAEAPNTHAENEVNPDPDSMVIPRVEEQLTLTRRIVETGKVRVTKSISEYPVTVDEPTIYEEYKVERVPVNRVVTETGKLRVEGDTTIIPVYEEEVVTTTRLILREEIHLTKSRREEHKPQTILLRRENVDVERTSVEHTNLPPKE